jgi:DNA polymerase V
MYALVDGNNFYASCERAFNPALRQKPLVVLSNNDGIVIARSNEVKAMGIKTGTPAFQIKKLIEQEKIIAFSSNFALYGDMSQRMMNIFKNFSPDIEIYSIDEAFLDFSTFQNIDFREKGIAIRKQVLKNIGIPVSVGFAPTKTLAKMANRIAKKYMKSGVALIDTPEKIERALKMTAIEDVWGIGRKYSKMLQQHQIKTAWEFTRLSDEFIRKKMSVVGLRTKEELLGTACIPMEFEAPDRKTIRTARSFAQSTQNYNDVAESVATFAGACAQKLRSQKSVANLLTVFIRSNRFDKNNSYYANNFTIQLAASNSSIDLIKAANKALKIIFKEGVLYKKAGVMVSGLQPDQHRQLSLFDDQNYVKHKQLMQVIDKLNAINGYQLLKIGAEGQSKTWRLKQEHRSNRYTTRWDELIEIKV